MRTRKNLPKTAIPRIYFIDRKIASGCFPNARQLAVEYETSMASINRDIAFMRDMLNAPIAYDAAHRGFYYTDRTFRLAAGFASPKDLLALGIAKNLLILCEHTPIYESARRVLEEVSLPLKETIQWLENRVIVPQVAQVYIVPGIWDAVIRSLHENKVLSIIYKSAGTQEPADLVVHPYQLIFDSGAWYLYGYGDYCSAPRMFSLSRMLKATVTELGFNLPKDYEYCLTTGGSRFGVFSGDTIERYSVEFFGKSMTWIGERMWAEDQSIVKNENSITITFTSTQYGSILGWVLSQGGDARPLEPQRLVREWKENIALMNRHCDADTAQGTNHEDTL